MAGQFDVSIIGSGTGGETPRATSRPRARASCCSRYTVRRSSTSRAAASRRARRLGGCETQAHGNAEGAADTTVLRRFSAGDGPSSTPPRLPEAHPAPLDAGQPRLPPSCPSPTAPSLLSPCHPPRRSRSWTGPGTALGCQVSHPAWTRYAATRDERAGWRDRAVRSAPPAPRAPARGGGRA